MSFDVCESFGGAFSMYFVKSGSDVCHILADTRAGVAPCGQTADKYDMWKYQQGELTVHLTEEKPADKPLCKHCEKSWTNNP
jgi:hypothetical protein